MQTSEVPTGEIKLSFGIEKANTVDDMKLLTQFILPNLHETGKVLRGSRMTWVNSILAQLNNDDPDAKSNDLYFYITNPDEDNRPMVVVFSYSAENKANVIAEIEKYSL
jgi:hypothetical protein